MKITKIEYENFRNFKDYGEIRCSTDGKVTLIYGKNGDGKTTLHQLFQWILYGQVHFNKTTTNRLYNLKYESECSYGDVFDVMGRIDFEHDGRGYSLTRVYTYKKGLENSEKIAEDLSLNMMDDDFNWRRVDKARDTIEKLLPSGLSEYFFFDGESMIADLRVKGRDSARRLKTALYSMFDLDIMESAIAHLGRTDLKTTVLGKLYLDKGTTRSGSEISTLRTNIENAQNKLTKLRETIEEDKKQKLYLQEEIRKISEQIGGSKSKLQYEIERKGYKKQREVFLKNAKNAQSNFGEEVLSMFPQLLISKAVQDAKEKIHLKVEKNQLPMGVGKRLIEHLLDQSTEKCICGHLLHDDERECIRKYLDLLPPRSYTSMYNEFSKIAQNWGNGYDRTKIESHIKLVLDNEEAAFSCDNRIRELDEIEKKSPDIENLVVARQQAETKVKEYEGRIVRAETEYKKFELYLKQKSIEYDRLTNETENGEKVLYKIKLIEAVLEHFNTRLAEETMIYSEKLETTIQELIDQMLTSKRRVSVSPEFSVTVTDSYQDESKSEGQFAVVSFAYIGGILKMLQENEGLSDKEYPLILDGPFSKLDPDQRQNVVDIIPRFAPQVILFSKDDLHDVFSTENIGQVWTIESNDEKNVATVREGHLWR